MSLSCTPPGMTLGALIELLRIDEDALVSGASGRKQGPLCCLSLLRAAPRAQTLESSSSFQLSRSVVSSSLQPMDCSMPGFLVHHQLLERAQTHVHRVSKAI